MIICEISIINKINSSIISSIFFYNTQNDKIFKIKLCDIVFTKKQFVEKKNFLHFKSIEIQKI